MDMTVLVVCSALVGSIVGFAVEHGLGGDHRGPLRRLAFALVGFFIAGATVEMLVLAKIVDKWSERGEEIGRSLESLSRYASAVSAVQGIESPVVRAFFADRLEFIDHDLGEMRDRKMRVPRNEILNTWERLIRSSKRCVWATNLVSQDDWKAVSRDEAGLVIQADAIKSRQVEITRISFFDESVPGHREGLAQLKRMQEDIGVRVFELPIDWIQNETYLQSMQALGTPDVVLVDGELLLLTRVNPKSYKMEWATLTYDHEMIAEAGRFYRKLLGDVGAAGAPQSCP